jgi:hypothetical protein
MANLKTTNVVPEGLTVNKVRNVKPYPQQAMEAYRVVRCRGSHIFEAIGSQMAVRLSALHDARALPQGRFLVLISIRS